MNLEEKFGKKIIRQLETNRVISLEGTGNQSGRILSVLGLQKKYRKIFWIFSEADAALLSATLLRKVSSNVNLYQTVSETADRDFLSRVNRQQILAKLTQDNQEIVSTDIFALFQKVVQPAEITGHQLKRNQSITQIKLIRELVDLGYQREDRAIIEGDFAVRGEIIDIYSLADNYPARVIFAGNQIENIYLFDPASGEKVKEIKKLTILPLKSNKLSATLLEYFPKDALLIFDEPDKIAANLHSLNIVEPKIPRFSELQHKLNMFNVVYFQPLLGFGMEVKSAEFDYSRPAVPFGNYQKVLLDIQRLASENYQIFFSAKNIQNKIEEMLSGKEINYQFLIYDLPEGLISKKLKIAIYTEKEIFGTAIRFQPKDPDARQLNFLRNLTAGDLLVHIDHGVCRFIGLKKYSYSKDHKPVMYVFLEFKGGARLFLPAIKVKKISKYIGAGGARVELSELGGTGWARVKRKVSESTYKLARELLAISAIRKIRRGFTFTHDWQWEKVLSKSFKYQVTVDQQKAISQVYQDMSSPTPMDRLICGDVGFGKTEVAVRAAARAAANHKQVAVICPTTILAEQHLATFRQRLGQLPVKVESLSRFKSRAIQKKIIGQLSKGHLDIVVGTHRLLQKDVQFSDLGLVIIDEEQRFGVGHKERLKRLRAEVDVLTLSATPIPRTLYSAFGGLKEISKIQTPPSGRLPILTSVGEFDLGEIKKIIKREAKRGGQVFFIHNAVKTIYSRAFQLEQLLSKKMTLPARCGVSSLHSADCHPPKPRRAGRRRVKIGVAHGQMHTGDLAKVMAEFTAGKYQVLLATTIVENGLDLSNVNTLIVEKADRFGLAELYQLRGRVGRGNNQAYAHLMVDSARLTEDARKRLAVLLESKELGSGLTIAERDLEIRGGGNILGREQSGNMSAVGLNLYTQLLTEAIEKLKK